MRTVDKVKIMAAFDDHERTRWTGRATAYDRSFARLCAHPADALLTAAGVGPGTRTLDVGTGPGTVATLARTRGAAVHALDAEPTMLALAATRLPDTPLLRAALPALPYTDAAFDAVVANFVLNHVGAPIPAVAELNRITRPGGRVALTIWPSPPPPAQRLWGEIFDAAGVVRPATMPRLEAEHDFPRTEAGLASILTAAGLTDIRTTTLIWTLRIAPEDWWSGPANGLGVPGLILEQQPPAALPVIRAAFDRATAGYRRADGLLHLPTAALLAVWVRRTAPPIRWTDAGGAPPPPSSSGACRAA